ncbi:hypothetical protein HAX54_052752 [Datura stramonium]|uniref:Uncharacterized protein n=1 Tax=Datura stramonium TaxID=4076 RepID=A0ABS8T0D4_DATST|nr:hypothetical protein [Datura stramonium]
MAVRTPHPGLLWWDHYGGQDTAIIVLLQQKSSTQLRPPLNNVNPALQLLSKRSLSFLPSLSLDLGVVTSQCTPRRHALPVAASIPHRGIAIGLSLFLLLSRTVRPQFSLASAAVQCRVHCSTTPSGAVDLWAVPA